MPEPKPTEIFQALETLRADVAGVAKNSLTGEERKKLEDVLDHFEDVKQKSLIHAKHAEGLEQEIASTKEEIVRARAEGKSATDRILALEAMIAQRELGTAGTKAYKDGLEYKALTQWVKRPDMIPQEMKAEMRTDIDTAGGFLIPTQLEGEITKEIIEKDPIRAVSRVTTIAAKTVEIAVRTSIPRAEYEGEGESNQEKIGGYRLVSVTPYRQSITVPATMDLLMNSPWDMESEIASDAGEGFAEGEGINFLTGTGVKMPEGITVNTAVVAAKMANVDQTNDATFSNRILEITGELKIGYNPMWALHRRMFARIRYMKSATTGEFLFQPGLNGPAPSTLAGYPYILSPSMAAPGAGTGSSILLFGDFRRGYRIVDRTGMGIIRDEVTKARQAIVQLTLHRWNTGIVVLPEAFKLQQST